MSGLRLFVDDLRKEPEGWNRAHSITEAIRILATMQVDVVSLDHDIILMQPSEGVWPSGPSEETFATVARYIALMPEDVRPKRVYIHTSNPDGAKDIKFILKDAVPELIRIGVDYETQLENEERQRLS